jgi:hypothetical protein
MYIHLSPDKPNDAKVKSFCNARQKLDVKCALRWRAVRSRLCLFFYFDVPRVCFIRSVRSVYRIGLTMGNKGGKSMNNMDCLMLVEVVCQHTVYDSSFVETSSYRMIFVSRLMTRAG